MITAGAGAAATKGAAAMAASSGLASGFGAAAAKQARAEATNTLEKKRHHDMISTFLIFCPKRAAERQIMDVIIL